MEALSSLSVFESLVITLIVIGLIKIVSIIQYQRTYWKKRGVPYTEVTPLVGIIFGITLRRKIISDYIKEIYHDHQNSRYFGVMDFATPTIIIRDPELIKDVAIKHFDHFPDHRGFVTEEMDPIFGKNVFSLKGDRWKTIRNTLSPFFTASKMKFMFGLVSKCSYDFVDYFYNHPECCSMIRSKEVFTRYTNDVIATAAFGITVNSLKDQDNEFYKTGTDTANFMGILRTMKFLMFRISPRLTRMAGITFLSQSSSNFLTKIISETVKIRETKGVVRPDMIHLLMQARDKGTTRMTIDDMVAQAFIFFLAGFDTSSTLMCYLTHELAMNQDVQEKLRKEVDHYLAEGKGEISYEALMKMEYIEMVISEILRMYPPVLFIDRLCAEKFELPPAGPGHKSVVIQPDQNIWFPTYSLHHDPKYFPNPEKFDPERFSKENKDNIVPYTYIPFGIGPRMCIGNRFALMETKLLIVHLLQKFIIKPNEKTKPIKFKRGTFQLIPKDGFLVSFEKRDS
ncbi:cytochrome P450 9e2-like [Colletes gigas]|uniref:cytochrome P450 9e2-like n=1 Tax=Colletes gigas TaxID=935657 RepID=UPI001C9B74AF|nr:cytochrome P450 9e2-like [Colletes gigas]